jgi:hypothetical protein
LTSLPDASSEVARINPITATETSAAVTFTHFERKRSASLEKSGEFMA